MMLTKLEQGILRMKMGTSRWTKYPKEKITRVKGGYMHVIYPKPNNPYYKRSPVSTFVRIEGK